MIKTMCAGILLATCLTIPSIGYPQPAISKEAIPSHIPKDIRGQIEQLYSPYAEERTTAIIKLGEMGEQAAPAVPFLVSLLSDFAAIESQRRVPRIGATNLVRNEAIGALVKIGTPAVEPLIEKLIYGNEGVRKLAAWGLGAIGDHRALEPMIVAARDENAGVRYRAVEALEQFNDPGIVEPLIGALQDKDANVRKMAAKALSTKGDGRIVEPMIAALQDKHPDVRCRAIDGLKKFNDPRAVKPLIAALKDDNSAVRYRAVELLGTYNDPRSVEPIIGLLEDPSDPVRIVSLKTLEKMTGKSFGLYPGEWQKWYNETKGKKSK